MRPLPRRAAALLFPTLALAACDPAGSDLGFEVEATGRVAVGAYLDRDGTGSATPLDTVFAGAAVQLRPLAGGAPLATGTTDDLGLLVFDAVRFGDYLVTVSPGGGDSVQVTAIDADSIRVAFAATDVGVSARLGYQEVSIRQARAAAAGSLVSIRGTILAGVQVFGDQSSHMADTSLALRMTGLTLVGGLAGHNPGDSVVVRGVVGQANGQPILSAARLIRVATRPAPVPVAVTSGVAATAQNGQLDAALVTVTAVTVSDSGSVAPNFRVVASDGSGAVTIILDGNIPFNPLAFRPGRILTVRGVLVPDGQGSWILKPRTTADVTFLN